MRRIATGDRGRWHTTTIPPSQGSAVPAGGCWEIRPTGDPRGHSPGAVAWHVPAMRSAHFAGRGLKIFPAWAPSARARVRMQSIARRGCSPAPTSRGHAWSRRVSLRRQPLCVAWLARDAVCLWRTPSRTLIPSCLRGGVACCPASVRPLTPAGMGRESPSPSQCPSAAPDSGVPCWTRPYMGRAGSTCTRVGPGAQQLRGRRALRRLRTTPPPSTPPPPSPEWGRRFFRFLRVGHSAYPLFVSSFPLCLGSPECGLSDCFSPRDG